MEKTNNLVTTDKRQYIIATVFYFVINIFPLINKLENAIINCMIFYPFKYVSKKHEANKCTSNRRHDFAMKQNFSLV